MQQNASPQPARVAGILEQTSGDIIVTEPTLPLLEALVFEAASVGFETDFPIHPEDRAADTTIGGSNAESWGTPVLPTIDEDSIESFPTITFVAKRDTLRELKHSFLTSTIIAEFHSRGLMHLVERDEAASGPFISTESGLHVIHQTSNDEMMLFETNADADLAGDIYTQYANEISALEKHNLRAPPLTRVVEGIEKDVSANTRDNFFHLLYAGERVRRTNNSQVDPVDPVRLALAATAREEDLLYDIGHAAERIGIASKATVSREKTALEDQGYLTTQKVPVEVGRPRLRLQLIHDELHECGPDGFYDLTQQLTE